MFGIGYPSGLGTVAMIDYLTTGRVSGEIMFVTSISLIMVGLMLGLPCADMLCIKEKKAIRKLDDKIEMESKLE